MLVGWPPEDLADGAAGGKNYAIWLHFARKKYGKTAKFRTGLYARNRCINKIVVSVCKGIDRYARNMDMPSRFGGSLTVVVPVHNRTAGNNIVVVLRLAHRQNRVRGHWRTGSNNSGVEEYLRKQSYKTITRKYN